MGNRKLTPPSRSKGKGVADTSVASGLPRAPRATVLAANANGSGLASNTMGEHGFCAVVQITI